MPEPEPKFSSTIVPFVCQDHKKKKCRHVFPHIHIVEIGGIRNILVDGAVFERFKFQCPNCSGWNYHNVNEGKLEDHNALLYQILAINSGQKVVTESESAIITTDNSTG